MIEKLHSLLIAFPALAVLVSACCGDYEQHNDAFDGTCRVPYEDIVCEFVCTDCADPDTGKYRKGSCERALPTALDHCSFQQHHRLTFHVGSELPATVREATMTAVADWRAAGVDVRATESPDRSDIQIGDCSTPNAAACWVDDLIVLDAAELDACRYVTVDGLTQCLKLDVTSIIRHELGHWLGFTEHLPNGNVMQSHYGAAGDYPTALTDLDIQAVLGARSHLDK